jgi:multidrug resistance efflux pump
MCDRGDQVHIGDILLQLDTHDLRIERDNLIAWIDITELRGTGGSSLYRELENVKRELARLTITAPSDGHITWITPLHEGEMISCGQTVALLARK